MPSPPLLKGGGVFTYAARDAINSLISQQGIATQGNVFWVRPINGSDLNDGSSPGSAFKTLTAAQAAATANQNDVVVLCAEGNSASKTTDYQATNLAWAKDGVHLIGLNSAPSIGQRSRVSNSATATVFGTLFTLSANGCLISGIEFFQGAGPTTLAAASTCVNVSGSHNHFKNCQISGMGDTTRDYAGSNSLTLASTAEENLFEDCYIGLSTVIRATSVTEVIVAGPSARNTFLRCHFDTYTSSTSFRLIQASTAIDRWLKLIDCDFTAAVNIPAAAVPAGVIGLTANPNGVILVRNPAIFSCGQITSANNAYVYVLGMLGSTSATLTGMYQPAKVS